MRPAVDPTGVPVLAASSLILALSAPVANAMPPAPGPIVLSPEEASLVAKGDVMVRYGGDARQTVAVVDVAATPDAVMSAVMDLPARVRDIDSLTAVDIYSTSSSQVKAQWTMSFAMINVNFHIAYDCAMSAGWCVYSLDSTRENDLDSSNGSYQAYPHGSGTRLVYRTDSLAAGAPEWVRKKLAGSAAKEMLGGMKTRAETP